MRILDVGCNKRKTDGAIGIDLLRLEGVDVVADIEKSLFPFLDSSFDKVICSHILEHVADLMGVMRELHRITRPGGQVLIRVPYFASVGAFRDPTHKRFFTARTFHYFVQGTGEFSLGYFDKPFQLLRLELQFVREGKGKRFSLGAWLAKRNLSKYERHFSRLFPAREILCELSVIK